MCARGAETAVAAGGNRRRACAYAGPGGGGGVVGGGSPGGGWWPIGPLPAGTRAELAPLVSLALRALDAG